MKEKNAKKEGGALAVLAIILAIMALLLIVLLLDSVFVPSGELWNELRQSYIDSPDADPNARSDSEIWSEIKQTLYEEEVIPVPSGTLSWLAFVHFHNEELRKEAEHQKKIARAREKAGEIIEIFNENADNGEILPEELTEIEFIIFYGNPHITQTINEQEDRFDELVSQLSGCFENEKAAVRVIFMNGKCTSAAFAPDCEHISVYDTPYFNEIGGISFYDSPYYDENGHYFEEMLAGAVHNEFAQGLVVGCANEEEE